MFRRVLDRFKFWLERQLVRGAHYRLLVVAMLVGAISVAGGAAVLVAGSGFESSSEAVWWAFLRLSDPGYLGDDVGAVNRTISTVLTVLGYVVFLGALVAVMTQWLNARMEQLESGLTPVARNDHVLILGWTNRTVSIVEELLLSEGRVRRFLRRHGARELQIVLLAREVNARFAQDVRDAVGEIWEESRVTLRSGDPLRVEHLERVDYLNAAAIIIPGAEFGSGSAATVDTNTVKTLLSLGVRDEVTGPEPADHPFAVAEVFDAGKVPLARKAYSGDLEVIASDAVISRLLAQNVRHPGLSQVYNELLTHGDGAEIYVRELPDGSESSLEELSPRFPGAVLMGVVRREAGEFRPYLNAPAGFRVREGDRLVCLARSYADTEPSRQTTTTAVERGTPHPPVEEGRRRKVLILGWNHKVPALLQEFASYPDESYDIRCVSTVPVSRREQILARLGELSPTLRIDHVEGDYTREAVLAAADPASHGAVLFLGSDRQRTEEESDARTIVGSLVLREILPDAAGPGVILELLDPENVRLLERARSEVIISPLILSHMLAQVALRRELRTVFDELFTAGGAEVIFRHPGEYGLSGTVSFERVGVAAAAAGETALGIRSGPGHHTLDLCPGPGSSFEVEEATSVVALTTYE